MIEWRCARVWPSLPRCDGKRRRRRSSEPARRNNTNNGVVEAWNFHFSDPTKSQKKKGKEMGKKEREKEFGKDVAATAIIAGRIYAVAAVLLQSHYTQPLEYNAERTSNAK